MTRKVYHGIIVMIASTWVGRPYNYNLKLNNAVNMRGACVMLLLLVSKTFFAYSTL